MKSQIANPKVEQAHDLALGVFHHLKGMPDSPERTQHIFRMMCAVERAAAGVLDEAHADQALSDVEAAALFCQG